MYSDLFTNAGFDCWNWPLIVDADDRSLEQTIRISIYPSNIPVIDGSKDTVAAHERGEKGRYGNMHANNQERQLCKASGLDREYICDYLLSYYHK